MTAREFLRLFLRRWYVVLAGAVLTGAVVFLAGHPAPVYWSTTTVVVTRPPTNPNPNNLQNSDILTPAASMVVLLHNGGVSRTRTSDINAPLYGRGVKAGSLVTIRNLGGQWAPQIQDPNIDIQVVDRTPTAAAHRMHAVIGDLAVRLDHLQDDVDAPSTTRLFLDSSAPRTLVEITPNARRAQAAVLLLGIVGTGISVRLFEGFVRRREARTRDNGRVVELPGQRVPDAVRPGPVPSGTGPGLR